MSGGSLNPSNNPSTVTKISFAPPQAVNVGTLADADYSVHEGRETDITTSPNGEWSAYSAVGNGSSRERFDNQDGAYVKRRSPTELDIVVADGMGGTSGGHIAASVVLETIYRGRAAGEAMYEAACHCGEAINERFQLEGRSELAHMGAAFAGVTIDELRGVVNVVHQGDVQVLIIDEVGNPVWLSREHTLGQYNADIGNTPLRQEWHTLNNCVMVGGGDSPVVNHGDPFVNGQRVVPAANDWFPSGAGTEIQLKPGYRVIVASDGLYDVLGPEGVAKIASGTVSAIDMAATLRMLNESTVQTSNAKDDNTTVVVYTYQPRP